MTKFYTESQNVNVSRISREGWWLENGVEHVAANTALGADCTTTIYQPSKPGLIAKYQK
ncbi:hypothetical protein [Vibrio marisflavi]|uniref:Uncharacterized protein n=1 Tax=Vibrio marisflavi CECT 7928 TaxID=634439 RepID=A0ABM9AA42_9VIBR|nr:hypothetical protein [Vibrio marisflavi]CAH0543072.1 hypothetical protein VMF7928_04388 [Vibrio marisflavi CECT 7928]